MQSKPLKQELSENPQRLLKVGVAYEHMSACPWQINLKINR